MAWFWSSRNAEDEEEYEDDEEYDEDDDEEYDEDDDEEYDDEDEEYEDNEDEEYEDEEEEGEENEDNEDDEEESDENEMEVFADEDVGENGEEHQAKDPVTPATEPADTVPELTKDEEAAHADAMEDVPSHNGDVDDDGDDVGEADELVLQGAIPSHVGGKHSSNRDRAPSLLSADGTLGSAYENEEEGEEEDDEEEEEGEEEDDDKLAGTSMEEKQSLLLLAAEHDRVDILQALLKETEQTIPEGGEDPVNPKEGEAAATETETETETTTNTAKAELLDGGFPPLHVATSFGSVNAINFLLRVGADPSIRPNVADLPSQTVQTVRNAKQINGVTAWELAFGTNKENNEGNNSTTVCPSVVLDLPPSKKEGIRHAFASEALRCIGSDEETRLQQLLASGMPHNLDVMLGGGKSMYQWAVDMEAQKCQQILQSQFQSLQDSMTETTTTSETTATTATTGITETSTGNLVLREKEESANSLHNRLDELEALARALSTCLDNLAEEVSVCHGLLLMGGGASALAKHVRSLKELKSDKEEELGRMEMTWENMQDQLAYWVREVGPAGEKMVNESTLTSQSNGSRRNRLLGSTESSSGESKGDRVASGTKADEDSDAIRRQLRAQIEVSETKVRKLRVSMADLSEENARSLEEVDKRGLTGGINLVRGLREEIRELEFQTTELQTAEAAARAKISLLQSKAEEQERAGHAPTSSPPAASTPKIGTAASASSMVRGIALPLQSTSSAGGSSSENDGRGVAGGNREKAPDESEGETSRELVIPPPPAAALDSAPTPIASNKKVVKPTTTSTAEPSASSVIKPSDLIATGQSTAIAVVNNGDRGYFPLKLWQILLRIIGMGPSGRSNSANAIRNIIDPVSTAVLRQPQHTQPAIII